MNNVIALVLHKKVKPLFVLLIVFAISLIVTHLLKSHLDYGISGRIALSSMLVFTSIGHFVFNKGMVQMLPDFLRYKRLIVYVTGIFEIVAAIGILFTPLKMITGVFLILFFIIVLPANIYAAVHRVNYETGEFDGKGSSYLWFRIPFQVFLIVWTFYFAVR